MLVYTAELDESLVKESNWHIGSSEKLIEAKSSEFPFRPGDRIVHSIMGAGEVMGINREKAAYLIKFDGLETVRSISLRAKIEAENGRK
ncbi:CarD family transcriptional regulator [Desulfosporosinus sp. OT]|uniref:CarD family transcriptional regulator n=1 Tax=Desulfosporosinus sp. OT TaxID=913865 RepID=UPI0032B85B76